MILSEYERRLRESENDRHENGEKLRQIIESLLREKEELSDRLVRANQAKLIMTGSSGLNKGGATASAYKEDEVVLGETQEERVAYVWNAGIIRSKVEIGNADEIMRKMSSV